MVYLVTHIIEANLYEDSGDSTDNALRLGGYASYNWDNFFVDISPSMGIHIIESNRKLITNGLTAKGERTGLDFNIKRQYRLYLQSSL